MPAPIRFLPCCAVVCAFAHAAPALAGPCSLEVSLALSPDWHRAARAIDDTRADPGGCERVNLRAAEQGALVVLTTRDGRRAERSIERPEELAPTVAALRVTVPDETPAEATAPVAAPAPRTEEPKAPSGANPAADQAPSAASPQAERSEGSATLVALAAGTRGGQSAFYSPVLTAAVSVTFSRWEVGGFGALEFQYANVASPELEPAGSAIAGGVFAGRRGPLGAFELFGGARLSLGALFANADVSGPAPGRAPPESPRDNYTETRLGAYMGASFPRRTRLRLRADLAADMSAGQPPGPPLAPQWALGATVGLELRL